MGTAATRPNLVLTSHTAAKAVRWAEQSEASAGCPPPRHYEHSCKQVLEVEPGFAQSLTPTPSRAALGPRKTGAAPTPPPPLPPGQLWEDGRGLLPAPSSAPLLSGLQCCPTPTLLKLALRKDPRLIHTEVDRLITA